jgi:lipopolysaccharide cholinephosphotransferase
VAAAKVVSLPISKKRVEKLIYRNESRFESVPGQQYYLNLYSAYSMEKEMIDSKWLQPAGEVTFNGIAFPSVNDTDAYLRHLYGNYKKLPPREKRHPGHEEEF